MFAPRFDKKKSLYVVFDTTCRSAMQFHVGKMVEKEM